MLFRSLRAVTHEKLPLAVAFGEAAHTYWREHWGPFAEFLTAIVELSINPSLREATAHLPRHGLHVPALRA